MKNEKQEFSYDLTEFKSDNKFHLIEITQAWKIKME